MAGVDGITWLLALSEGEIIDNKYVAFNSINYYNVTAAASTLGFSGILTAASSALSILTEGVVINPALAKIEFDIEEPTEWGKADEGFVPDDFSSGKKYTFSQISDWAKWVVYLTILLMRLEMI